MWKKTPIPTTPFLLPSLNVGSVKKYHRETPLAKAFTACVLHIYLDVCSCSKIENMADKNSSLDKCSGGRSAIQGTITGRAHGGKFHHFPIPSGQPNPIVSKIKCLVEVYANDTQPRSRVCQRPLIVPSPEGLGFQKQMKCLCCIVGRELTSQCPTQLVPGRMHQSKGPPTKKKAGSPSKKYHQI